jgi:DnaJ like chaperone protein
MLIWGKIAGAIFGFAMGGWVGLIIGVLIGHYLDNGLKRAIEHDQFSFNYRPGNQAQIQTTFFTTVFSVMGHIAKADGRVSESEITIARNIMRQMQLNSEQEKTAIDLFTKGKAPDFPLEDAIDNFHKECHHNRNLERMFIEILLFAAYADGHMHDAERHIFFRICKRMGISEFEFRRLEKMVQAQQAFHGRRGAGGAAQKPSRDMLNEAYDALGIDKSATDAEVKKAYRRQMNQHHPDKLVAKGLPEEMIKLANEKTQEIKSAYDTICQQRGIK